MNQRLEACGVILAGGQSTRMGFNKALAAFQGEPLVQRLARRFAGWFEQVILVTNTPSEYEFLGLPMYGDRVPGLGPLGGLEAGLSASRHEYAFFCATDMPFVSEGLVRFMVGLGPGHDIVVPQIAGEFEPMHAVYARSRLKAIASMLEARRLRLVSIYNDARIRTVAEQEVRAFGNPDRLFFNCNTPADLEQALTWAREDEA